MSVRHPSRRRPSARRPLPWFAPFLLAPALLAQSPTPTTAPAAEPEVVEAAVADVVPVVDDELAAKIRTEGIEHSQAMRILRDLTGTVGHRLTGSSNFTKACDWAVMEFEKMGLSNVHKEHWGEWKLGWNRGTWKGRITKPIELDVYVATPAWTASTNGPRTGRILRAPADEAAADALGDSMRGAFLYYESERRPPRGELRARCEQAGIAGWIYKASGDQKYPTRVRVFGDHRVAMGDLADVPTVPVIAMQSDHAERLEQLLDGEAEVEGEFQLDSEFVPGPIPLHNVIAEIPGTTKPDEVVIVCGHLDSWHQAQGCTDNGTGTTTTMEAARILAAVGARPERTIRFCLCGGEEEGLLGSAAYVKMHRSEMDKVSAVFNHDTGTNWAASLSVTEGMMEPMQRVFAPVMALQAPDEDHIGAVFRLVRTNEIRGGGGSDHASFIAAGVPGLNWNLKGRSDYFGYTWHSQWDTIDVAIEEYQRHTSTVIALAALGTANLPELLDRSAVSRGGGRGNQATTFAQAIFDAEMDGLKFTKVQPGGRAAKMGIQVGDVLHKAGDTELEQLFSLFRVVRDAGDAKEIDIELKRGDGTFKTKLDLEPLRNLRDRRRGGDGARGGDSGGTGGGTTGGGASRGGQPPAQPAGTPAGGAAKPRGSGERGRQLVFAGGR